MCQQHKSLDSWVTIHNLKISSDDGILDPDDILSDVADDREQIIAIFDEQCSPFLPHNGGDGTSASSVGTESPDIFQNEDIISALNKAPYNGSDVEITAENISSGIIPLHVRRGSEPALNRISPAPLSSGDPSKRWSAAVIVDEGNSNILNSEGENSEPSDNEVPPGEREDGSGEEKSALDTYCSSSRKLIDLDSDCDELTWHNEFIKDKRREPLGGPRTSPKLSRNEDGDDSDSSMTHKFEVVKLKNEDGPLGIHVVPTYGSQEKNFGLLIQGIEPGGRIDRDGRCHVGDKITEINGVALGKESFQKAQEIFKDALRAPEISISCIRNNTSQPDKYFEKVPPPVLPKPVFAYQKKEMNSSDMSGDDEKVLNISKSANITPSRKSPASMLLKNTSAHSSLRKVGRRILVHLTKGSEGLGFSISAKEPASSSHLFVKNILPAGAAVEDGRLKVGDRIMEVNKIDVANMTQSEVVDLLRQIPFDEVVEIIVSRQETDNSPSPSLPRELPPDKAGDGVGIFPWKSREVFTFDIPLNDTGSAGLGVSVKGKTSTTATGPIDMGIFVKSVIHGGAASKDGRLQTNDQLLNINGISLLGMTNSQAMETLRRAMIQGEGPNVIPNAITLTVARRIPSPAADGNCDSSDGLHHDRSDSLLSESGDSFYVSTENLSSMQNKSDGITPETSTSENSGNTVIFMSQSLSQSQRDSTVNHSTAIQDISSETVESKSPLPGGNPILEHLTGIEDFGVNEVMFQSKSALYDSYEKWSESEQQETIGSINTTHEENHCFSPTKPLETKSVRSQDSIKNLIHQKSFSNPAKLDYVVTCEQMKSHEDNSYSIDNTSAALGKKLTLHTNSPFKSGPVFSRNGFGRQSMPEKKIINAAFREVGNYQVERLAEKHQKNCTSEDFVSIYQPNNDENATHSTELMGMPKEMPVDVGPCETYVKLLPNKPHRNRVGEVRSSSNPTWSNSADSLANASQIPSVMQQRSCNSPGCPYHVVPTAGRESNDSQGVSYEIGPSLGMCKSSSLESLQTMVHELQKRDVPIPVVCADGSTRACNESFRAAVDRSYDAQDVENIEIGPPIDSSNILARMSPVHIHSNNVAASHEINKKNSKCGKKKGILRGLGSVFKFGRTSKKSNQEMSLESSKKDEKQQENECLLARKAAQEELERIQERYRRFVQQQHTIPVDLSYSNSQQQQVVDPNSNRYLQSPTHRATPVSNYVPRLTQPGLSPQSQSRRERMHFLRAEHQRRHQERRGYYPQEEKEELYEAQIKQIVDNKAMHKRPLPPLPHQRIMPGYNPSEHLPQISDFDPCHSKTYSFDIYKEMSKPGSRMGFADPNLYSHYMNFQEIQQHLQQFHHQNCLRKSQMQDSLQNFKPQPNSQTYNQSSARTRTMSPKHGYSKTLSPARSRPISNFFEYESVHSAKYPLNLLSESGTGSLPRRNFASSRRQPIPPAFMMQSRRNIPTTNGHAGFINATDNYEDIYYARKFEVPGSKV